MGHLKLSQLPVHPPAWGRATAHKFDWSLEISGGGKVVFDPLKRPWGMAEHYGCRLGAALAYDSVFRSLR